MNKKIAKYFKTIKIVTFKQIKFLLNALIKIFNLKNHLIKRMIESKISKLKT